MRKIRLDLDALAVESFSPAGRERTPAGTVQAHAAASDIPTLHTGYHGCYACVGSLHSCRECEQDAF
jgi:hypothetical protein